MATTGLFSLMPPAEPQKGRFPKENTPPSEAARSYPAGAAGATQGPANVMFCVPTLPAASPKVRKHESPAACWAVVGGQGYLAASVAASPPVESVPVAGGPTVPVATVKSLEKVPVAEVATMTPFGPRGAGPHETGVALPATITVGWPGSLLHSTNAPAELSANPVPVTVTDVVPV